MLLKDERCDQESAQHKEEVDPEGSIRRPVKRMEANYDRDGDAANTVERPVYSQSDLQPDRPRRCSAIQRTARLVLRP
jgi:hypothetical protein